VGLAVHQIQRYSEAQALACAEATMGTSSNWRDRLTTYRLDDSFQEDWTIEAGRWLLFARDHGFFEPLVEHCLAWERYAAARPGGLKGAPDTARHLWAELTPAMVAYYLGCSGWSFCSWERGGQNEKHPRLLLRSPTGFVAEIQARVPGYPRTRHHLTPDEVHRHDAFVALEESAKAFVNEPGIARLVVLASERRNPVDMEALTGLLVGQPSEDHHGGRSIDSEAVGAFGREPCDALNAVIELGLVRAFSRRRWMEEVLYRCTVLVNPWAATPVDIGLRAFPHARIFALRGRRFVWQPDEPEWCAAFPSGLSCHVVRSKRARPVRDNDKVNAHVEKNQIEKKHLGRPRRPGVRFSRDG
jgi:hypothetical protein